MSFSESENDNKVSVSSISSTEWRDAPVVTGGRADEWAIERDRVCLFLVFGFWN